jgi:hypothetical protein
MLGTPEIKGDHELKDIRHNIRETLQVLQLQYGFVEQAVDTCVKFEMKKDKKECKIAAVTAHNETEKLLQVSLRLVEEIHELHDYVIAHDFTVS